MNELKNVYPEQNSQIELVGSQCKTMLAQFQKVEHYLENGIRRKHRNSEDDEEFAGKSGHEDNVYCDLGKTDDKLHYPYLVLDEKDLGPNIVGHLIPVTCGHTGQPSHHEI